MNDQNSGGVSRFSGSFMSPCAPLQTTMNDCLVLARKSELKEKNKAKSAKLREQFKEFKEYKEPEIPVASAKAENTDISKSEVKTIETPVVIEEKPSKTVEYGQHYAEAAAKKEGGSWLGGWFSK
jgi:seryl-tRNA synthetase